MADVSAGSSRTSIVAGGAETSDGSFLYARRVLVIRAGPRPRRHACVLLNKRTASTLEHVLSAFASAISIESGHVRLLYGVNTGIQVLAQLIIYSYEQKTERTKSTPKCAPFADPLPLTRRQPNFACGVDFRISFLVLSFRKIGRKMWGRWPDGGGRNVSHSVDKAHRLYNSLLLPHRP